MTTKSAELEIRIRALVEGIKDLEALGKGILETAADTGKVGEATEKSGEAFAGMTEAVQKLDKSLQGIATAITSVAKSLGALAESGQASQTAVNALGEGSAEATTTIQTTGTAATDASGAMSELATSAEQAAASTEDAATAGQDAATGLQAVADAGQDAATGLQDAASAGQDSASGLQDAATAGQDAAAGMEEMAGASEDAATSQQDHAQASKEQSVTLAALLARLKEMIPAYTQANREASGLAKATRDIKPAADQGKAALKELQSGMKELGDQTTQVTALAKRFVVAFTAFLAIKGAKEMADIAARTETLGVTMDVVARNAGYSAEQMRAYEAEVKKLGITTGVTREALTKMIQSGLQLGPAAGETVSQVSRLARAAQDLAVVTGQSSSDTLQRLIVNISQLDTVGLRFMGIIVNSEAAQARFAASIGKTTDQLTQQQKTQAFANAVLMEADKLAGAYEKSLDTVGKKLGSLSRYQEEAANAIGEALIPAYGAVVDVATEALKKITELAVKFNASGDSSQRLGSAFTKVFTEIGDVIVLLVEKALDLAPIVVATMDAFGDLASTSGSLIKDLVELIETLGLLKAVGVTIGLVLAGLKDGLDIVLVAFQGLALVGIRTVEALYAGYGALVSLFDKEMAASIDQQTQKLKKLGDDTARSMNLTVERFANGETSVVRFANALDAATKKQAELDKNQPDFSRLDAEITKLVGGLKDSTITSMEAGEQAAALTKEIELMGKAGKLTESQVRELSNRLNQMGLNELSLVSDALQKLGLTLTKVGGQDYFTPVNKQFGEVVGSLSTLATNAKATGAQFDAAFAKGIDTAKTINDVGKLSAVLGDAQKSGRATKEQFKELENQFLRTFENQLKAANTRAEIDLLRKSVIDVGSSFPELRNAAALALEEMDNRAKRAGLSVTEIGKQAMEVARQQTAIAQAQVQAANAELDVGRARRNLELEIVKAQKDGSDVAMAKVEVLRTEAQLADARKAQADLAYKAEQQAMDLLIAKQKQLNVERAVGIGAATEAQAKAAEKEVEARQKVVDQTNLQLEAQKKVLIESQRAKDLAEDELHFQQTKKEILKELAEAQKKVNEATKEGEASAERTSGIYKTLFPSLESIRNQLQAAGVDQQNLVAGAQRIFDTYKQGLHVAKTWGKVADAINFANKQVQDLALSVKRDAEGAENLRRQFENAKQGVTGMTLGMSEFGRQTILSAGAVSKVGQMMQQIKQEALQMASAAESAAQSFLKSTRSIEIELLEAQGREAEASKMRFDARKQELALQYELLRVQIQTAIAAGKAAKVPTYALEDQLRQANVGYEQAVRNLNELERIDAENRRKREEEQKAREEAAKREQAAEEAKQQSSGSSGAVPQPAANDFVFETPELPAAWASSASTQSIAETTTEPRKVEITLIDSSGRSVTGLFPEDEEQDLLSILENTRRRS